MLKKNIYIYIKSSLHSVCIASDLMIEDKYFGILNMIVPAQA